jgi:hypothetical protein
MLRTLAGPVVAVQRTFEVQTDALLAIFALGLKMGNTLPSDAVKVLTDAAADVLGSAPMSDDEVAELCGTLQTILLLDTVDSILAETKDK